VEPVDEELELEMVAMGMAVVCHSAPPPNLKKKKVNHFCDKQQQKNNANSTFHSTVITICNVSAADLT
jgi:hypothetical protein